MLNDHQVEARIRKLRQHLSRWLKVHRIDTDVFFKSYVDHFSDDPGSNALVMCITHYVDDAIVGDLQIEFHELIESLGFWYDFEDATTVSFHPVDDADRDAFRNYLRFHYFSDLLAPDFADVYSEIFQYFAYQPSRLEDLHWRSFEELVASVFKNQGYRTELGRGWSDQGVDIRLLEHSVHGEVSTLVQVKKYRRDRPIRLDAVAALSGHMHDRGASKGIFVTTSRFLPGAKKFAARQDRSITLADSGDLAEWCRQVSERIGSDPIAAECQRVLAAARQGGIPLAPPIGQILVASVGSGYIDSRFALVVRATSRAALLVTLQSNSQPCERPDLADFYPQIGYRSPSMNSLDSQLHLIKAQRVGDRYWGEKHQFWLWDGKPLYYDLRD